MVKAKIEKEIAIAESLVRGAERQLSLCRNSLEAAVSDEKDAVSELEQLKSDLNRLKQIRDRDR